ncbi:nucleolin [Drosophila grimshawi]|uniref:GH15944 n=1 Tax=Drosophila grimshawi TaxID=7222 RepID=B4J1I3_DROGR|nr:nucleolin [Drosophila grimshawi]EDV95874.1 GH15944 [Drosophila grimshawi]
MKKRPEETIIDEEESMEEEGEDGSDDESEMDLAASATESDTDDDADDSDEAQSETEETESRTKTRVELIEEQIHSKYEQLRGTRLYVRFPKKLPLDEQEFETKVKSLHPLISKATKPRQKHARFCLVDFKSKEDRDAALEDMRKSIETDDAFKGFFVSLPKTDSDDFVNELVARKQQSIEKRKTKSLLKRASKQVNRKDNFTSSVVITNLPKTASLAQVRQLFENAVDIQIKPGRGKFRDFSAATVTLPTTFEARGALKKDLNLGGSKLTLRFNTQQKKRRPRKNERKRSATGEPQPKKHKNKKAKQDVTAE